MSIDLCRSKKNGFSHWECIPIDFNLSTAKLKKMNHFVRVFTLVLLLGVIFSHSSSRSTYAAEKAENLPPRPYYYVSDEEKILTPHTLHAAEALLVEHDRLTGEQFMVALIKNLNQENLTDRSHQIFTHWQMGNTGQNNGMLLTVFYENQQAYLEVGFGLEDKLTDTKTKPILSTFVIPELKKNDPNTAIVIGIYHLLEALDSPLIQSGKAAEILHQDGLRHLLRNKDEVSYTYTWKEWVTLFTLGITLLIIVLSQILSREAQFTRRGWYRHHPWKLFLNRLRHHKKLKKQSQIGGAYGYW